jgi:hypothetical protein
VDQPSGCTALAARPRPRSRPWASLRRPKRWEADGLGPDLRRPLSCGRGGRLRRDAAAARGSRMARWPASSVPDCRDLSPSVPATGSFLLTLRTWKHRSRCAGFPEDSAQRSEGCKPGSARTDILSSVRSQRLTDLPCEFLADFAIIATNIHLSAIVDTAMYRNYIGYPAYTDDRVLLYEKVRRPARCHEPSNESPTNGTADRAAQAAAPSSDWPGQIQLTVADWTA